MLISATHTHSSTGPIWPGTSQGYALLGGDAFNARVFELTADGIAEAILAADARLTPARVGIATTQVHGASRNRNFDPFGRNPDVPKDEAARRAVSVNPTMTVIRVDEPDGRPLGVWSNFAVHNTSFGDGNLLFSADNAGSTERIVERAIRRAGKRGTGRPAAGGRRLGQLGRGRRLSRRRPGPRRRRREGPARVRAQLVRGREHGRPAGRRRRAARLAPRGAPHARLDPLESRQVFLQFDGTPADGEPVGPWRCSAPASCRRACARRSTTSPGPARA